MLRKALAQPPVLDRLNQVGQGLQEADRDCRTAHRRLADPVEGGLDETGEAEWRPDEPRSPRGSEANAGVLSTQGKRPQFAMIVALAASTAFMTPVSSPVDTLVVGPGNYRFSDFVRIGVPFSVIVMVISVILVSWLLPLYPG